MKLHERIAERVAVYEEMGWEYPLNILDDIDAKDYVSGSAWHCYCSDPPNCDENAPDKQALVHDAHPDKGIYFTECTGGEWDTGFASVLVWNFHNLFIGAVRHWAKTVLL